MPNISDNLQASKFINALRHCESNVDRMSEWEQSFVKSLRELFDSREDALDLGMTPWNPSASQWNTLMILQEEYS